jgi:hypothetical protein
MCLARIMCIIFVAQPNVEIVVDHARVRLVKLLNSVVLCSKQVVHELLMKSYTKIILQPIISQNIHSYFIQF